MLIEFRVSNYRSIAEEQILSLIPAPKQKEYPDNIFSKGSHKALNAIAMYGANASGKSNLLKAMRVFDVIIHASARSSSTTKLPYDPFLLSAGWEEKPTKFEITFIIGEVKYRYGVEYSREEIVKEWLYRKATGREVPLFLREKDTIDPSSGFKGNVKIIDAAIEATRPNALFLSTCDMLNVEEAKDIFQWLQNYNHIDGIDTEKQEFRTVSMWDDVADRTEIEKYLAALNLGFTGIDISKKDFDESDLPPDLDESTRSRLIKSLAGKQGYQVNSKHKTYSADGKATGNTISWRFDDRESKGTHKAFHLSGPILSAIKNGGVLIIDEIEAKMHPLLTLHTVNYFLNKETNPNNAQIIFATHDTNLLTYSELRRDQIYFTEKNTWEATEIFSLSDFIYLEGNGGKNEKERPDTDKEKRYFEGRYGAVPFLGRFKSIKTGKDGEERKG